MLIGKRLNGRYKIIEAIGGGGMANVYHALDMILDRDVAVKVLRPEFSDDEEFIRRFRREAQAATSLSHENIVSIYDVGEEDHIYYIVMEYIDGTTLKKFIQQNAPLRVEEVIRIMKQLTAAIEHAHDNHIIHRDIKPQNILINGNGVVKVTDFGIAMALTSTTITHTNSVMGSVHYLSPEQARGGIATNKSDIYALGIVMFELLTGRLPFSGESAISIALKHLQTETPSVRNWNPDIPQSVENIVLKATAKDPFHRYKNVGEMINELDTALEPDRLYEKRFEIPDEDGEKTKAIPVVTDEQLQLSEDKTIVRNKEIADGNKANDVNEVQPTKQKRSMKKWLTTTLVVMLLIAGATAAAFTIIPSIFAGKDVEIPDVRNMEYEEAVEKLTLAGLTIDHKERHDEEIEEGKVIKTDPKAGTTVKEGYRVTVYESLGKNTVKFGDFVGKQLDEVRQELSAEGFVNENIIIREAESDKPEGEILEQKPYPGDEVIADETRVELTISKGLPIVTLKDMRGWTEEEVHQFAEENNLKVTVDGSEYSDQYDEGLLISHNPGPFDKIEQGGTISIKLSKGPEPPPAKEATINVTIPYEPSEPGKEQLIKIYIGDAEHNITSLYDSQLIDSQVTYQIKLKVAPGSKGEYKIIRDEQIIIHDEIAYDQIR